MATASGDPGLRAGVMAAMAVGRSPRLPELIRSVAMDLQPLEGLACVLAGAAGLLAGGRAFSS